MKSPSLPLPSMASATLSSFINPRLLGALTERTDTTLTE
jgi:hypothetical protein